MKKRRTIIISLLLVAALALGVGYAYTTGVASVNVTASNTPDAIDLEFATGGVCKIIDTEGTPEAIGKSTVGEGGYDDISFHANNLQNTGDYVVAEFVVVNNNNFDVRVHKPTVVSQPTNFNFEIQNWQGDGDDINDTTDITLAPSGTTTFRVKVSLKEASPDSITETFTINISGDAGQIIDEQTP